MAKLERKDFTRKFLLRVVTGPWTLLPVLAGATVMLLAWAIGLDGSVAFAGAASTLAGAGVALTRVALGDEKVARKVLVDMENEVEKGRQRALDELEERLSRDRDPRDERLLQDLRALASTLRKPEFWPDGVSARSSLDISTGVESLFGSCVASLERQAALLELAASMRTAEAKAPIKAERERILQEVTDSIAELGRVVARVQAVRDDSRQGSELGRIREEIDQSLQVAARVAARMNAWEKERQQHFE